MLVDFSLNPNGEVKVLVDDALKYLETRTEFWRQQRPVYARKKQGTRIPVKRYLVGQQSQSAGGNKDSATEESSKYISKLTLPPKNKNARSMASAVTPKPPSPTFKIPREKQAKKSQHHPELTKPTSQQIVDTSLSHINSSLQNNDYTAALRKTKSLLYKIGELSKDLGDLSRLQAELYDIQAGIYLKIGSLPEAALSFKKEADIATSSNFKDCILRSHTELGKIYIKLHKEPKAIQSFEIALKLLNGDMEIDAPYTMETLNIYYEIAKAYYTIKNYTNTIRYGQKAIEQADKLNHQLMAVKARVVVGRAQVIIKDYHAAVEAFTKAVNLVKETGDKGAVLKIFRSLNDAKRLRDQATAVVVI